MKEPATIVRYAMLRACYTFKMLGEMGHGTAAGAAGRKTPSCPMCREIWCEENICWACFRKNNTQLQWSTLQKKLFIIVRFARGKTEE